MRVLLLIVFVLFSFMCVPAVAQVPANIKSTTSVEPKAPELQNNTIAAPPLLPVSPLPKSATKDIRSSLNQIATPQGINAAMGSLGLMVTLSGGPEFCLAVFASVFVILLIFGTNLVRQKWPKFITLLVVVALTFALILSAGVIKIMLACSITTSTAADCGTAQGFTLVAGVFPLSVLSAGLSFLLHGIVLSRLKVKRQKASKS